MNGAMRFVWPSLVALLLVAPGWAAADEPRPEAASEDVEKSAPAPKGKQDVAATPDRPPVYQAPDPPKEPGFKPPHRGKPAGRVGGGSRGVGAGSAPRIVALVPEHVARTAASQPSLFWYIDGLPAADTQVVFTIIDEKSVDPVSEIRLAAPARPGIQRIRLADHGVTLELGIEYEWSVAIVLDPAQRASDIIASGWIDRVAEPQAMVLGSASETRDVNAYAEQGLWYDALTAISDRIDQNPGDASLLTVRAALLEQVGLDAYAGTEL